MKKFAPLILILLSVQSGFAQPEVCGTELSQRSRALLIDFHPNSSTQRMAQTVRRVAVSAHIIRRSDGTGGLTSQQLSDAMVNLNEYYENAQLEFLLVVENEILSDQYFDFVTDEEVAMGSTHDVSNTINIYFANSVGDGNGGAFCGYAYFPGGPDRILMDNSCTVNGTTLPHEIGHYFTLYHTHGKSNGTLTDELVERVNCETAGDELCDTPADPQLSINNVNSSCVYTGRAVDANNDPFQPDPTNIMSYSRSSCRDIFSEGQYSRMSAAYELRDYLYDRKVVAKFTQDLQEPCSGTSVSFSDKSLNATSWQWLFEGGSPESSTAQHPVIQYDTPGTYDVKLMIADDAGEQDTLLLHSHITAIPGAETELIASQSRFESATPELDIQNADDGTTFEITSAAASEGSQSIWMNFYEYANIGAEDYLKLPFLDNSFSREYEMTFDYAYTYYDATYSDKLAVVYRPSCEAEWVTIWSRSGAGLATANPSGNAFVPTKADWRSMSMNLSIPESVNEFEVAFKTTNGWGNNLYIDNISLKAVMEVAVNGYSCPDGQDGSISVITTGSQNYEFSIDGQNFVPNAEFSGLKAGDYTVTVRDALGRTYTEAVNVPGMELKVNTTSITCFGEEDGVAAFEIVGGQIADFDFAINGSPISGSEVTGMTAGEYTVTISSATSGCTTEQVFSIAEPEAISATLDVAQPACFGEPGQVKVSATGGAGGYSYQLDDVGFGAASDFDLSEGDHTITVKDENDCMATYPVAISEPDSLYLQYTVEGFLCPKDAGGRIEVMGNGGTGAYTYQLNGSEVSSSSIVLEDAGEYELTVTDGNGCSISEEISIDYAYETPEKPVISREAGQLMIDETDADISWYVNGDLVTGADSSSIPYTPGTYQVTLSYGDGLCEVSSEEFLVLSTSQHLDQVRIFPNPFGEAFEIQLPEEYQQKVQQITVYDMSGSVVFQTRQLNIRHHFPAGIYLLEISGEGFQHFERIIRKN